MPVPTPMISVLGVHRVPVDEALVQDQARILWGWTPSDGESAEFLQVQRQLQAVVLVELQVDAEQEAFNLSAVAQRVAGLDPESLQAPWAEAYLSGDGGTLLSRWDPPLNWVRPIRVAFFLHQWDESLPLSYGNTDLETPKPTPMSARLAALVPFEPAD